MSQAKSGRQSGGPKNASDGDKHPVYARKYWTGSGQLEVAVFANPSENGDRVNYSTVVKKTYRSAENEFRTSKSFYHEELPLIAAALLATFNAVQVLKDEKTE